MNLMKKRCEKMKRILIVEDDSSIAELERDYLEMNNFIVQIASDGDAGIAMAKQNEFDLIILDIMLPGKNGFEICRELRAVQEIPILMVSAKNEDIDKVRGLGIGADDYIVKPFSPSELVARVKAHLNRYERLVSHEHNFKNQQNVITAGKLKILPKAWRVYIDDEEVKLTNKEFELLVFLASNPNVVFNKEEIFQALWDVESIGDIATVAVHINRLRDKIEQDSSNPLYIETVWGAGYRFKL